MESGRWRKSNRQVKFPMNDFHIFDYLTPPHFDDPVSMESPALGDGGVVEAIARSGSAEYTDIVQAGAEEISGKSDGVCTATPNVSSDSDVPEAVVNIEGVKAPSSMGDTSKPPVIESTEDTEEVVRRNTLTGPSDEAASGPPSGSDAPAGTKDVAVDDILSTGRCIPDIERLDPHAAFFTEPAGLRSYDLYAMAIHLGIMGGGHYVAQCKNPNGNWYLYNDSSCKESSVEDVEKENG